MANEREIIARRIAQELKDGDVVNLGIGLPTMVADFLPSGVEILLQSENGMIGMGPAPVAGEENPDICNAGGAPSTVLPGGAFFDSSTSFAIIRGGHVDLTVLGALEVDQEGSLASHIVPGRMVPGMGGAMDLIVGSKKVIIATTHTKKGNPKILTKCKLPLTAYRRVNYIVTELCFLEVTPEGLLLREIVPGLSVEELQKLTEAPLIVAADLKEMQIAD